ncbi:hypothetical protein DL96DRAFT_1820730, partial [Flagelloscypha sp. PMI_526]
MNFKAQAFLISLLSVVVSAVPLPQVSTAADAEVKPDSLVGGWGAAQTGGWGKGSNVWEKRQEVVDSSPSEEDMTADSLIGGWGAAQTGGWGSGSNVWEKRQEDVASSPSEEDMTADSLIGGW